MDNIRNTHADPYERSLVIYPRMPSLDGIFDLVGATCIAAHGPHGHIPEHLHDHFHHLHIRYGFEIPQQSLIGIDHVSLEVMMAIKVDHRVDCNPVFVARGNGSEGVCLKFAGQDVHWVHSEEAGSKATRLLEAQGKKLPPGYYFSGFRTSDVAERKSWKYSREELKRAIGFGLRADQHFQATWREPRDEPIEPYEVVICLSDDESTFHTFFNLPLIVPIGAC